MSGLLVLWVTRAYLAWAILGVILAYIAAPFHRWATRALGNRPGLAAGVVVGTVLLVVAIPLVILVWAMLGDAAKLASAIGNGGFEASIAGVLAKFLPAATAERYAASAAEEIGKFLLEFAPALLLELVDATVGVFILVSALLAVLVHRDELYEWVRRVIPMQDEREEELLDEVGRAVDAVVFGIGVVAVFTAAVGGLLWWLAGLPSVIFWTFVLFVVSMIPALGPSLVVYPGALYAYYVGNIPGALVLLVGGSALILVVDVYLRPALIAKKGGIDGTLALLGVMGGIVAMGPIGIFAGPLVMAIFVKVMHLTLETHKVLGEGFTNAPRKPKAPAPAPPPAAAPEPAPASPPRTP